MTAIHFARLGASVVITGRDKNRVELVAEECRSQIKGTGKVRSIGLYYSRRELLFPSIRY